MKLFLFSLIAMTFLFASAAVQAAESLIFDSTNHYLGGCQLTDKSAWELTNDITVSKFQIWYKWNTGETSLPVTVLRNGEEFASFETKRGDCDPYQTTWCNADYAINKLFPKGSYTTEIPNSRQCLKPGGTGTVRLYSNDTPMAKETLTPTSLPTAAIQPSNTAIPVQARNAAAQVPAACTCNQTVTIAAAAALSSMLSVGISLLLRKR